MLVLQLVQVLVTVLVLAQNALRLHQLLHQLLVAQLT